MYPIKYASALFDKFVSKRPKFLPTKWHDAILSIKSSHGWRVCATVKFYGIELYKFPNNSAKYL